MSLLHSESVQPADQLLEIYRRHGFDSGYHQALQDQLEGLVLQAERFLARREGSGDRRGPELGESAGSLVPGGERAAVYAFVAELERTLTRRSPFAGGFVDGAGI